MNEKHLELCSSERWAENLEQNVLPWVFELVEEPADLLEVGPGPGATTGLLRKRVRHVTAVENDPALARKLTERFAADPAIDVRHADATDLPFPDSHFSAAASFTMLHHLPSAELQDRLFAEVLRVVRPGGAFFGTDSLDGPGFRVLHEGDTCTPIDPLTLGERLRTAGFVDVDVSVLAIGVRFLGRKPI